MMRQKTFIFLLISCFFSTPLIVRSQLNSEKLQKKIVIRSNTIRIDSLFDIFSKQTGIEFSFNSRRISPSKMISIKPGTKALKEWLESLKQSIGINYSVLGNHIIVTDYRPPAKQPAIAANRNQSGSSKPDSEIKLKNVNSPQREIKSLAANDTENKSNYQLPVIDVSDKAFSDTVNPSPGISVDSARSKPIQSMYGVSVNNPRDTFHFISVDSAARLRKETNKPGRGIPDREGLRPLTKLDVGLQGVGLTFERRLSNKTSIDFSLGVGGGYNIIRNGLGMWYHPDEPTAYVAITPKLYYNTDERSAKGKTTDLNSGNYIGLRVKYISRSISESSYARDALMSNVHWGMQRAISRKWTFNFHAGIGYITDATDLQNTEGNLYPAIDFKFSRNFTQR